MQYTLWKLPVCGDVGIENCSKILKSMPHHGCLHLTGLFLSEGGVFAHALLSSVQAEFLSELIVCHTVVVVVGMQRLRRGGGRGRVFEGVFHPLPPLRLKLQGLLQLPLGLLLLLETLLDGGCGDIMGLFPFHAVEEMRVCVHGGHSHLCSGARR